MEEGRLIVPSSGPNTRIFEAVAHKLRVPWERVLITLDRYRQHFLALSFEPAGGA